VGHAGGDAVGRLLTEVQAWLSAGSAPNDVAVLTRVNALLLAPQIALAEANIPVHSTLSPSLLERTGVRTALAYLRLAGSGPAMRGEDLQLVHRRPNRRLPPTLAGILGRQPTWNLGDLRHVPVGARSQPRLERLVADLAILQSVRRQGATTADLLALVRTKIGLGRAMEGLDAGQIGELASHVDDLEALEQVAILHPDSDTFETWLRHAFRVASDPDGVVLATVHKVKGQEWPRVLIYEVNEGLMPHRLAAGELEEERRIMHVALTRGREEVLLLFSSKQRSRFLRELQEAATPRLETKLATAAQTPRQTGETRIVGREAPPHPVRPRPVSTIVPHLGDTLVLSGGYSGIVIYIGGAGVSLRLATGAQLQARWGERAERHGHSGVLAKEEAPPPPSRVRGLTRPVSARAGHAQSPAGNLLAQASRDDWTVDCPECGARRGSPCLGRPTRDGVRRERVASHLTRVRLARVQPASTNRPIERPPWMRRHLM
jgi:hypothetical protein